jgi:hypothetical protein
MDAFHPLAILATPTVDEFVVYVNNMRRNSLRVSPAIIR